MKRNYSKLLLILFVLSFKGAVAQFSGAYAVSNWGTVAANSDGVTNTSGAPNYIVMTSGNNQSGSSGTNDFTISVPQTGQITFSWTYSTVDGAPYDYPQFVVNNNVTTVNGYNTSGSSSQSGTQPCINVTQGDVFRLRMYTVDNVVGAATTTISNFAFTTGAITVTPASPSVCAGNTVMLTASGGGTNYTWSGGITNGVAFTPTASTVYTVSSGQAGCISTKTVPVTFYPGLQISPATPSVCTGSSITLTTLGGTSYTWSTGPSTNTISVGPTTNTSYSVAGTTTAGCSSNVAVTVTVTTGTPTLSVVSSNTANGVCPGKTVALTASGAVGYSWTGGITNGAPFTISTSTTFVVTGTNACGSSTAAASVSIHPTPTVSTVASSASLCSGQSATLVASGASTYSWQPFGGNNQQLVVSPAVNSTYTVVGTSALGCTNQAVTNISVVTTPVLAPVVTPTLICVGKTATLSASGATSYSWSTGQTTSVIVVSPTTTTSYVLTKSNANCVDVKTATLIVNALPSVFAIGGPTLICSMQSTTLNAGGGATYSWSPFGGNSSQAIVNPAVTTDFIVSASDGTCINSATVPITVNPLPTITIVSTASAICVNQSASMTLSGTDSYSWTNPPSLGTATSVVVTPTTDILYQVTGTNTVTGCSSVAQQILLVRPLPSMTVAATKTLVCVAGPSTLTVKGNTNTLAYSWSTGPTTTNTIVNPTVTTVYSVTGTNTVTSCQSTSMVAVNVFQPTFATNSPTSSCLGGTISLIASGASSYTWQTNPPQPFSTSTTVNNLKCNSQDTVFVSIYSNPTITAVPSRTAICKNETVDLIGGGGATYTWSTFQVGDTVNVKPLSQTNYTVTGTDQNGCKSTATVQVKVSSCVGIDENGAGITLSVYPNPSNGEFTIESASDLDLILINELGQLIRNISVTADNNRKVQVSGIANGIYFLKGVTNNVNINQKIIITD
jgi:hypothetical protein